MRIAITHLLQTTVPPNMQLQTALRNWDISLASLSLVRAPFFSILPGVLLSLSGLGLCIAGKHCCRAELIYPGEIESWTQD